MIVTLPTRVPAGSAPGSVWYHAITAVTSDVIDEEAGELTLATVPEIIGRCIATNARLRLYDGDSGHPFYDVIPIR